MHVAIIGGASTVGSTAAYTLVATKPSLEISLVDPAKDAAWAHAKDMTHAKYHLCNASERSAEASMRGHVMSVDPDDLGQLDPDIVMVTATVPRSTWTSDDSDKRRESYDDTRPLIDSIASQLNQLDPLPVIVVTNPIDRITYRFWDQLGWSRSRFIGFSLAEAARAADKIAQLYDVPPNSVHCPIMGEHGEHVTPIFSRTTIDGDRCDIPEEKRDAVVDYVRDIAFDIADRRGVKDSSRWVSGAGLARLTQTILDGGTKTPLAVATPLSGEYGFDRGCFSVPVTLNEDGVDEIREWALADGEWERLQAAHEAIQADLDLT